MGYDEPSDGFKLGMTNYDGTTNNGTNDISGIDFTVDAAKLEVGNLTCLDASLNGSVFVQNGIDINKKSISDVSAILFASSHNEQGGIYNTTNGLEYNSTKHHIFNNDNSGEILRIQEDGNVGIGINTPSHTLDVGGNIHLTGTLIADSDRNIKDNITLLDTCLEKIDHISGYTYTRNDLQDKDKLHIGVIAQEVETVFPELVTINEQTTIKSVNYSGLVPVLIECVKNLKNENKQLRENYDYIDKKMKTMENFIKDKFANEYIQ